MFKTIGGVSASIPIKRFPTPRIGTLKAYELVISTDEKTSIQPRRMHTELPHQVRPMLTSSAFAIFPVGVTGMEGMNKMREGRLYEARCRAACSANSVGVSGEPETGSTKAKISSFPAAPSTTRPITAERATDG